MPIVKYADTGVSPRTQIQAVRKMLTQASAVTVLEKLGFVSPLKANASMTAVFRRPRVFTAATTPMTEGVTPKSHSFRYDDISVTLKQYGEIVEYSDVIEDTHEDDVPANIVEMCGDNIGRTKEALLYSVLKAGTSVFYQNGSQRTDVNTAISYTKQQAVTRFLNAQKAKKITKVLDASVNVNTRPVQAAYVGVAHTDMEADIRSLPGFTPVAEYGSRQTISEFEVGSVADVRYVLSPDLAPWADAGGAKGSMVSTTGTSADVYPVLYFGEEAFAVTPLKGQNAVQPSMIPPSKTDKSDPLGQRGIVGWKTWYAAVIVNDFWMARLECSCSAL